VESRSAEVIRTKVLRSSPRFVSHWTREDNVPAVVGWQGRN
jgi:hypothetical protein